MHKTQQKSALSLCSFVVDSYFVGCVVWIAVVSSHIYIQYFFPVSSLLKLRSTSVIGGFHTVGFFYPPSCPCMHQFRKVSSGPHLWQISFLAVNENNIFVRKATQVKTLLIPLNQKFTSDLSVLSYSRPSFLCVCLSDLSDCTNLYHFPPSCFPQPRFWHPSGLGLVFWFSVTASFPVWSE